MNFPHYARILTLISTSLAVHATSPISEPPPIKQSKHAVKKNKKSTRSNSSSKALAAGFLTGAVLTTGAAMSYIKKPAISPTPLLYRDKKKIYPKDFNSFFDKLGVTYTNDNRFSPGCEALAAIELPPDAYEAEATKKYGPFIAKKPTSPCYIQWINEKIGYGLFASRYIHKGAYVMIFGGEVVIGYPPDSSLWSWDYLGTGRMSNFFPQETTISALQYGNEARFANHSEHPNIYYKKVFYENQWYGIYVALADITPGEELNLNYGRQYWQHREKVIR